MITAEILVKENERLKTLIDKKATEIGFADKIIYDGVPFPEKYLSSKYRLLWILKESYETNNRYGWHVIGGEAKPNPKMHKQGTLRQVCRISYGILHNCFHKEVSKANENDFVDVIQQIGWINLNKIAAGKTSPNDLTPQYNIWKDVLKEQIETYNPNIIICGNTLQYFSQDNYFEKPKGIRHSFKEGKQFCYYPLKDRLYINIHHPSYRFTNWNKRIDEIVNAISDWENNYKSK